MTTTLDDLINAAALGQQFDSDFWKLGTTAEAAGNWHSLWRATVGMPAAGGDGAAGSGTPGAGGTAATLADGTLAKWANQSPKTKYLTTIEMSADAGIGVLLYDRLVSVSGVALNSTGNKNVGSVALPRYTTGEGVQCWLEVTTITATTAPVVSMNSYTNSAGTAARAGATVTFPSSATNVDTFIQMPVQAGDYGVKSVETINVATASGGSAACNVVLLKPLIHIPITADIPTMVDLVNMYPVLQVIPDGTTFGLALLAAAASAYSVWGKLRAIYL